MQLNEYEEKFWGITSFYYSLENDDIWDVNKYWDLECLLIKLSKYLKDKDIVDKSLARNIYYLGNSINNLVYAHRSSVHAWTFKNYSEDDIDYCIDRFNHLMRVLWQAGSYEYEESINFFEENPLFKDANMKRIGD